MIINKVYRKNLDKDEKILYDRVKKLRYGNLIAFTTQNKNKTEYIEWRICSNKSNNIEIETCYGRSVNNNLSYSYDYDIEFVPEYDNYWSKFSNFDYMLIYILNWYHGDIDEYLKKISRKNKLIEIENKNRIFE